MTPDDPIDAIARAMVALRHSASQRRLAPALLQRLGPAPPHLSTLGVLDAILAHAERTHTAPAVADIADALHVDPSRASRAVAAAVEAGYVQRGAAQHDGRRSLLTLTPAGDDLLRQLRAGRADHLRHALAAWTDDDLQRLAELLPRLVDALAAAPEGPST